MSFTLDVLLKQLTPILHFQHDQQSATLRATEVKPKLDKFLIRNLDLSQTMQKGWLIGNGDQKALDYKIRFINGNYVRDAELPTKTKIDREGKIKYITDPEMYPQVLANMGGKDSEKELKKFRLYETVTVQIFTFHEDLLQKIQDEIPLFFATHNFGNRQTKGFGSFYIDKKDPLYTPASKLLNAKYESLIYWEFEKDIHFDYIFSDIDILYRLLKSGFNFPDHAMREIAGGRRVPDFNAPKQAFSTYQPSFLKNYFIRKYKIGNEKRAIKESLFRSNIRIKPDKTLVGGNQYIRAILGTAEFFEYRDKDRKGVVTIKSDTVERFQSAVTFKIFDNCVFLLPGDWTTIQGKMFIFESEGTKTDPLPVPTVSFNLSTFLAEFATWYNDMKDDEVERLGDVISDSKRRTPDLIKKYLHCLEKVNLKTLSNSL